MQLNNDRLGIVSRTDFWGMVGVLYVLNRGLWISGTVNHLFLLVCGCYVLCRIFRLSDLIIWMIIAAGTGESIYGIFQYVGWANSNHHLFDVTGSFGNPGQLGGLLAVSLLGTLAMIERLSSRYKIAMVLLALVQLVGLIVADSRAGWVAAITGMIILYKQYISSKTTKIFLGTLVVATVVLLFLYRPSSVLGRLLIWRVSADMILDKPILGHGAGAFNREYMLYQADYFKEHPDSELQQYSDNVAYPYNELIHVFVEYGIVGLFILIVVISSALIRAPKHGSFYAILVAWLVYAFFSYPSYIPGLLILCPLLLAIVENAVSPLQLPHCGSVILTVAGLLCIFYAGNEFLFRRECRSKIPFLLSSDSIKMMNAEEFIISNRERIRRYPRFVDVYAQYVYKFKAPDHALMILKETANIIPTCEIYCDIGDLFKEQKDYASAQYYYQRASDMIPRRLIPRYKLFMLYYEMNNIDAARMIGEDIVSKKNIIEGTQSIKIKMRVQKYLDKFRSTSY